MRPHRKGHPVIAFFCDLDDTLFSTKGKISCGDELQQMSWLKDGKPSGFATSRQLKLIRLMSRENEEHILIPVTARSEEAFSRVSLESSVAIVSHGGAILRSGKIDQNWAKHMANESATKQNVICVPELLDDLIDDDNEWRHWPVTSETTTLYYVIKNEAADQHKIDALFAVLKTVVPAGLNVERNGNNIAVRPDWLNKKNAVEHLVAEMRQMTPDLLTIGMGDSNSDLPFMQSCDYAMFPGKSQISTTINQRFA